MQAPFGAINNHLHNVNQTGRAAAVALQSLKV